MSKNVSIAKTILSRIEGKGPGSNWTYENFKDLPFVTVAKVLSRLTKDGKLVRVRKGIYHYPKSTALGATMTSTSYVLATSFPITYPGGNMAPYNLGITTQVPATQVLYGDVSYMKENILGTKVRFRRRSVDHLKNLGDLEINIIETLRNIKKIPDVSPRRVVICIKKELKNSSKTKALLKAVKKEPPRVRAIIGAIYEELQLELEGLKKLHKTLNPLTTYKLGVGEVLKFSYKWSIK